MIVIDFNTEMHDGLLISDVFIMPIVCSRLCFVDENGNEWWDE